ncbi:Glycosyl hydrolase family 49 [Plasmodiophora brassicae]
MACPCPDVQRVTDASLDGQVIRFQVAAGAGLQQPACIDVVGGSPVAPGAQLNLWACQSSWPSQQFTIKATLSPGVYQIRAGAASANLCLDAGTTTIANGQRPTIGVCSDEAVAQRWILDASNPAGFRVIAAGTCFVLDLYQQSLSLGTRIHLWSVSSASTQLWNDASPSRSPASSDADLATWAHAKVDTNNVGVLASPSAVRGSSFYKVSVAKRSSPVLKYSAFVYAALPRSGGPMVGKEDGAETNGQSFHWCTIPHNVDLFVDVTFLQGRLTSTTNVTIRPARFQESLATYVLDQSTLRVAIPSQVGGIRISIELNGASQWVSPGGQVEPTQAFMLFTMPYDLGAASSPISANVPYTSVAPGASVDFTTIQTQAIVFQAGLYRLGAGAQANLSPNVKWVHLAPGAFVRGAFVFNAPAGSKLRITGVGGVISGEEYVYEADTRNANFSQNTQADCYATCVIMLRVNNANGGTLTIRGVTVSSPPYHSFVAFPDGARMLMQVEYYHQVAAYYWQTDGLELFSSPVAGAVTTMRWSFFHSNDDVIKVYYSNLVVSDIVVWKGLNGPVIQWGWAPRKISNVSLTRIDVIHNRMQYDNHNLCLINAAKHYIDSYRAANSGADGSMIVANISITDLRAEGKVPCTMRIYPLTTLIGLRITNLHIDDWVDSAHLVSNDLAVQSGVNGAANGYIADEVSLSGGPAPGQGIHLTAYTVGDKVVVKNVDGTGTYNSAGRLPWFSAYWGKWNASASA